MATFSGAIFDLDGTIIDSMSMWFDIMEEISVSNGVEFDQELMNMYESSTVPEACELLHTEFGATATPEEIYQQIEDLVAYGFSHTVQAIPGSVDFIKALQAQGIPCVIASSTPSRLSKIALETNGIRDAFTDVLCAGEVREGRDKEFPDVYLEALERLGLPQDEVWVLEDAPFALKTARKAGFHVVGIHNDHDGRDESFTRAWSDIYSNNYDNVSLEAISAFDDASRKPIPED